ncbi:MAG: restriction endonuclease subunit S [Ignavibacteriales bacterium]|nr:restriction endonuclease subunit S [Ignavibacteriales bacterium]
MKRRFDPSNHRPAIRLLLKNLEAIKTIALKELVAVCYRYPTFYGFKYQESGILVLKGENIDRDGEIDIGTSPSFISPEINSRFPLTQVVEGDLLMSVRGEVGKVGIIKKAFIGSNINANTIRLSLKDDIRGTELYPEFVWLFLNSTYGQMQIKNRIAGGVQETITAPEILTIRIPVVSETRRRKICATLEEARAMRRDKLALADDLLASLDVAIMNKLGIALPSPSAQQVYAIKTKAIRNRFDPHFHFPEFVQLEHVLRACHAVALGQLTSFSIDTWNPSESTESVFKYIEISNVARDTGEVRYEIVRVDEAPSRARMVVKSGDIIVSLTRPHHGSIALIDDELDGCIASTGFAVLRNFSKDIIREYLWCVLRTQLSLKQMLQRSSGGNYPAITDDELRKILIPIPSRRIQKEILAEVSNRKGEVRRLRSEAESQWRNAKKWIEERLLEGKE